MARMSGARWRPLADNWASQPRMARYNLVLIHTAVGSFDGTYNYFRSTGGYSGAESHFMTSGAGATDQYQDSAHRAEANGAANYEAISVENADMGREFAAWNTRDGNAVPPFTAAQIEANARICAWAHQTHGIPLELVPDSKPGRRGIGYHRLGVPGYAVPGGALWSSARGKACPGPRRIAQIPQIIARARQIVAGIETEDPDMAALFDTRVEGRNVFDWFKQLRAEHTAQTAALSGQVAGLTAAVSTLARGVDGVDGDELKQHISAEVDRAMAEFRERVAEGYAVRLEPKSDDA